MAACGIIFSTLNMQDKDDSKKCVYANYLPHFPQNS